MVSWFRKKRVTRELRALVDRLATYGVPNTILDKLESYLREASDRELYQVNPRHIAAGLEIDVHTALGILAYAVQEGLFELDWNVHCPHHGRIRSYSTLNEGRGREYCPLCEASFDAHLDDEVHVTFTVNERVRKLSTQEPLPDDAHPPTYGRRSLQTAHHGGWPRGQRPACSRALNRPCPGGRSSSSPPTAGSAAARAALPIERPRRAGK